MNFGGFMIENINQKIIKIDNKRDKTDISIAGCKWRHVPYCFLFI